MGEVLELTRYALWLVLILSGPPIAAAVISPMSPPDTTSVASWPTT